MQAFSEKKTCVTNQGGLIGPGISEQGKYSAEVKL